MKKDVDQVVKKDADLMVKKDSSKAVKEDPIEPVKKDLPDIPKTDFTPPTTSKPSEESKKPSMTPTPATDNSAIPTLSLNSDRSRPRRIARPRPKMNQPSGNHHILTNNPEICVK